MSYDTKFNEPSTPSSPLSHLAPSNMQTYSDHSMNNGKSMMDTSHVPRLILRCKVVIVGESTVGKSAMTQMFSSGGQQYPKNYVMTCPVDFSVKEVPIPSTPATVELYLFDCAGQSIFNQRELNARYWENTAYVMCVFDVSNRESFNAVSRWLQSVRAVRPNTGGGPLPGVLVANKIDLREGGINSRSVITSEEGLTLAKENGLEYFECSAATGRDVDRPFQFIASQFYENYEKTVKRAEALVSQKY